ncbi:hypothetical protein [Mixta calida]|uniref:hypothetical protein n=1 Tax=Mixta calida TaxID=665913 RepID=UPI0028ADDBD0|nr:hypothetical protein [Mixta calida]
MTIDTNAILNAINKLVAEGYSEEEAGAMVGEVLQEKQKTPEPPQRLLSKCDDKAMVDYWRALREKAERNVWIPEEMKQASKMAEERHVRFHQQNAEREAAQRSKRKSMLGDSKAAMEFFRKK